MQGSHQLDLCLGVMQGIEEIGQVKSTGKLNHASQSASAHTDMHVHQHTRAKTPRHAPDMHMPLSRASRGFQLNVV